MVTFIEKGGFNMVYASFRRRLAAYLLDFALVSIIYTLFTLVLGLPNYFDVSTLEEVMNAQRLFFFMLFLYFFITDFLPSQGGIGKVLLKIKVVDMNGKEISFSDSLFRNISKFIQICLLCLPFVVVIFSKQKQGLHDMFSKCLVIKQ
ncbi:MAG: RDD family protein [Clostridium beijerinckii]|nr:RDD family protein [Clostridium beijerinckii]